MAPLPIEEYQIGIICALSHELKAIRAVLDEEHDPVEGTVGGDHNSYVLGRIGQHNVVAAGLPSGVYGTAPAASAGRDMLRTFSELRFGLLVGIAGGIPNISAGRDIRLGDVVVSEPGATHCGVVQYDLGKRLPNGHFIRTGTWNKAPPTLRAALTSLRASLDDDLMGKCLVDVELRHGHLKEEGARPVVHYGLVASGNTLLKNANERDQLAQNLGALCVEMEAAGLDNYPCLVIRGICDYANAQKNDVWQNYAALTAAAFAKVLLKYITPQSARSERPIPQVLGSLNNQLQRVNAHYDQQEQYLRRQEVRYQNDKERDCHRAFDTSNYEELKNVNPKRSPGTCQWLLRHEQYLRWQQNDGSDLLWISADPGCGKSVLSKSLVDHDLRSDDDHRASICYFFFKNLNEQDSLATALSAVLHQLFSHQPQLIQHALPGWEQSGGRIVHKVDELWRILQAAVTDEHAQHVVCVLDALDECRDGDRQRLISMLCQFYDDTARTSSGDKKLKFLVTSRPYEDIEHQFGHLATSPATSIRLRGEQENDSIHEEIDLVVRARVQEIVREFRLAPVTADGLEQKLLAMQHRTYLWLYLAIDSIRKTFSQSLRPDRESIELLPKSVDAAYEQILSQVDRKQTTLVRTILQIILGARRPLAIGEMAIALDIASSNTILESFSDFSVKEAHLESQIRQWCGLFVFVNHSRLYLIHQTAKEFLLRDCRQVWIDSGDWKHCFTTTDIDHLMARIFILYLCLQDFGDEKSRSGHSNWELDPCKDEDIQVRHGGPVTQPSDCKQEFFNLAAGSWADHWYNVQATATEHLASKAWTLYNMQNRLFSQWTKIMWQTQKPRQRYPKMNNLIQAAFSGHVGIVQQILDTNLQDLEARDGNGRTALIRGAENGHLEVVALLLDSGAEVSTHGGGYDTALYLASRNGYMQVVQILLNKGAEVDAPGGEYGTALCVASLRGHIQVVRILLDSGADINAQEGLFGTALYAASFGGHVQVVQMLLDKGAEIHAPGGRCGTALSAASRQGHVQVVQMLLNNGAEINTHGGGHGTALRVASLRGRIQALHMILDKGVDFRARRGRRGDALYAASFDGHEQVVQMLLDNGADVNAQGGAYGNALGAASHRGHQQVVEMLLRAGAKPLRADRPR